MHKANFSHQSSIPAYIVAGNNKAVLSWAADADPNTILQAQQIARSPAVSSDVALMADAHVGIGAPIGSVVVSQDAIIPAAVGVDIGCGMTAVHSGYTASQLPDDLTSTLDAIASAVPAGFKSHPATSRAASRWLRKHPLPDKTRTPSKAIAKMGAQLGTLGGGNHFIEVSLDEEDHVWLVLHSGSRGVGNLLASMHIREAKRTCRRAARQLENGNLAYLTEDDSGFHPYIADMLWAQKYALANRSLMTEAVLKALRSTTKLDFSFATARLHIDCHHNYAVKERHADTDVWVTRKGAIRARVDDFGVIPGSMGDDTYIVRGRGCAMSYHSASHGAGRVMSRTQARKTITTEQLAESMAGKTWLSGKANRLTDEAPKAYRRIKGVIDAQRELIDVEHRLTAILNYKGC